MREVEQNEVWFAIAIVTQTMSVFNIQAFLVDAASCSTTTAVTHDDSETDNDIHDEGDDDSGDLVVMLVPY